MPTPTPEVAAVEALAARYLEALRDRSPEAYRELHATYLERCATDGAADAYDHVLELEMRSRPADAPELRVVPVDPEELARMRTALAATAGFRLEYPDPPLYTIELTLEGPYRSDHPCYAAQSTRRVRKSVALRDERFYLAPACLSDAAIADLRASRRNERAVQRMQDDLYAKLAAEERTELLELIGARRGEEAVTRYREISGSSRGAAVRLVERLCLDL